MKVDSDAALLPKTGNVNMTESVSLSVGLDHPGDSLPDPQIRRRANTLKKFKSALKTLPF